MIATLHVPYGFGDCVNGFKYDGVITDVEYVRRMTKEYDSHKWGIDEMMTTRSGKNMAINPFQKENNKYKQQTPSFGELTVYVDDKEYNPPSVAIAKAAVAAVLIHRIRHTAACRTNKHRGVHATFVC